MEQSEHSKGVGGASTGTPASPDSQPDRAIVANWASHRLLQRLFADWATLWLPAEEIALTRWMSVGLAAGAYLAKWDATVARGLLESLEIDHQRSDPLYDKLLSSFAAADMQGLALPVRVRAAISNALYSRHNGVVVVWECGIEAIHAYAAVSIAWGIRALLEDELLAGCLIGFRPPLFGGEQYVVFDRLIDLCVEGPDDPRPLLMNFFDHAYAATPIEGQIMREYADRAFQKFNYIVSAEGLPYWAIEAFRAGQDLVREEPTATREIVAELRRVHGPDGYEDQFGLSQRLLESLGHPEPVDERRIYRELLPIIQERWPHLLYGHTYATHLRLWMMVFDQAFWTGLFATLGNQVNRT